MAAMPPEHRAPACLMLRLPARGGWPRARGHRSRGARSIREHSPALPCSMSSRPAAVLERSAASGGRHCAPSIRPGYSRLPMRLVRFGRAGVGEAGARSTPRASFATSPGSCRTSRPALLSPAGLRRLRALKVDAPAGGEGTSAPRLPAGRHRQDGVHRPQLHRPRRGGRSSRCPTEPTVFIKAPSAHVRAERPHRAAAGATKLDYEVELAVVIGREARYVEEAQALRHVVGYCIVNDVSERAFQMEHGGTTTKGKSADTLRAGRPVARDGRRDRGSPGPPALDHRERRAPAGRQHPPHGLPGARAGGLREPLHVAPAGRPDLHGYARRRGPRRQAAAVPPARRRRRDGHRSPGRPASRRDRVEARRCARADRPGPG